MLCYTAEKAHLILTAWYCLWKPTPDAIQVKKKKSGEGWIDADWFTGSSVVFSIGSGGTPCSTWDTLVFTVGVWRLEKTNARGNRAGSPVIQKTNFDLLITILTLNSEFRQKKGFFYSDIILYQTIKLLKTWMDKSQMSRSLLMPAFYCNIITWIQVLSGAKRVFWSLQMLKCSTKSLPNLKSVVMCHHKKIKREARPQYTL